MNRPARRPSGPLAAVALAALTLAGALPPASSHAQAIIPSTAVQAVPGAKPVSLDGTLKGPNLGARDYVVRLEGGRKLNVRLEAKSPDTWFAVLGPYGESIYTSEGDARGAWSGRLADAGEYRVRVYLGPQAERQGKGAAYALRIGVDAN